MKPPRSFAGIVAFLTLSCLATSFRAQTPGDPFDPVTMDPVVGDTANPPQLAEVAIGNENERLNALLYVASGRGPKPTVILLNGIPGNDGTSTLLKR